MKRRRSLIVLMVACMTSLLLLAVTSLHAVAADADTSTTVSLLRYEGDVEIEDASGKTRAVEENAQLGSGDSLKTAKGGSASVVLDEGRIVTLDEKSQVAFQKQDGAVLMSVEEGSIFLDVSEKLGSDETMDIEVAGVTVGIRGTIVFVDAQPADDAPAQIGVLEGTASVTYADESGGRQSVEVDAGQKATLSETREDAGGISEPAISEITREDIEGFVLEQVTDDESVLERIKRASDVLEGVDPASPAGDYAADGDWTWNGTVTLVAQSASKLFDGQPLTRNSDVLVDGLPADFSVRATAGGSRTDAGESDNPIARYSIYNEAGENVTSHFTNVNTVSGTLLVVPAPLTIHTESAEKVYDGTPLSDPSAYVTSYGGGSRQDAPWRNTSYVITGSSGGASYDSQSLYGTCGVTWVNAANPLTGERREIQLNAGQKLTVFISDQDGRQSIDLKIENLTENDLPEELLRLYGDNPALLEQACMDTGWDIELLQELIDALPDSSSDTAKVERDGLKIRETEAESLMRDLTNVRITVDTEITDYNNRALGREEARFTSPAIDDSIKVTATGSQTDVGESVNTYIIDWGGVNPGNYELGEELGTLMVTPAPVTVTTGSAEKAYDGTPLTDSEASISGLVNGETATVRATGSITEVGSTTNGYSIRWGSANSSNYTVFESLGTLRVTEPKSAITLTAASAEKTFDGTPLKDRSVTAKGLPSGFTVKAVVSGSQTDAGSSENKIKAYKIFDADGNDVTKQYPNVTTKSGVLTVKPLPVEFDCYMLVVEGRDDAVFDYDGFPYFPEWISASYEGANEPVDPTEWETDGEGTGTYSFTFTLPGGAKVRLSGTGYIDAGSYSFEPEGTFLEGKKGNYEITFTRNDIQIAPVPLTITASASKVYDGEPLNGSDAVKIEGLVERDSISVNATGTITGAGSVDNPYTIDWGDTNPNNYTVTQEPGTLTVEPVEIHLTSDCTYTCTDELVVDEYGLKVEVNNVDASRYSVSETEANAWQIQFAWGDTIDLSTLLTEDDESFEIIPIHGFVSGDSSNYVFSNTSQQGAFDASPVTPGGRSWMGAPPDSSSTDVQALADGVDTTEAAATDDAAADDAATDDAATDDAATDDAATDDAATDDAAADDAATDDAATDVEDDSECSDDEEQPPAPAEEVVEDEDSAPSPAEQPPAEPASDEPAGNEEPQEEP